MNLDDILKQFAILERGKVENFVASKDARNQAKEQIKALMYKLVLSENEPILKDDAIEGYVKINTLIERIKAL